jgi:hypothetical protein
MVSLLAAVIPPADAGQGEALHPVKVEIVETEGKYQLLRGGKPYIVNGAGIDHNDLAPFAAHGGNSFRTWAVDSGAEPARQLLDRAHALGLTVSLCLEIARERHGFDYNDKKIVAEQAARAMAHVRALKDHPALLTWIIGNELNYEYKNPRVYDAVNDISRLIHEVDPNHPTTTAIAGFHEAVVKDIGERAPDLDFLSIQMYGSLINLPEYIEKFGFTGPYFVTEWGSIGHWETWKTSWGAPVEQTSSEKADNFARSYHKVLEPYTDQAIGNYVFLWGQKQERTPTWYGMFTADGSSTEAVDVMHFIWNKQWPANRAPRISPLTLDGKNARANVTLSPGKIYSAEVEILDPENDPLTYRWEVRHESTSVHVGGDHEPVPDLVTGLIANPGAAEISFKAPGENGAYRLFVYANDGMQHAAHANIPFYVK